MSELQQKLIERFGHDLLAANSLCTVLEMNWGGCPVCMRKAEDLAVLNKNGEILCCAHYHHDHAEDYLRSMFDGYSFCGCWGEWINDAGATVSRFRRQKICSFCNEAEGRAKKAIQASKWFTFSVAELQRIVGVSGHGPVEVNEGIADEILDCNRANFARRMKAAEWLAQAAKTGELGPGAGHALRRTGKNEPKALRKLECDGSYASKHLAKKHGLA